MPFHFLPKKKDIAVKEHTKNLRSWFSDSMDTFFENAMPRFLDFPIDSKETDTQFQIHAELPGVEREDLDISCDDNRLKLCVEKKKEEKEEDEGSWHIERRYGSFKRTITIPSACLTEKTHAEFKNGVLSITIPKDPEKQPKKIEIA